MRQALILGAALALGSPALAAPADTLTDAGLLAYASGLFGKGALPKTPADRSYQNLGIHHGLEVQAVGLPCESCLPDDDPAIYYITPADGSACRKAGGRPIAYVIDKTRRASRLKRVCVPGLLIERGLYGTGQRDARREGDAAKSRS